MSASEARAGTDSAADFTIHPNVLATAPPRFGFNYSQGAGGSDITDNAWVADGGFSSYDVRMNYTASTNGATDGTTFIDTNVGGGTDFYNSLNSNGALNGGLARVYRYSSTTSSWQLIRTGTVLSMTAVNGSSAPADHTITFTTPGAQSLAGDVVWISKDAVYSTPDISNWLTDLASRFTYYAGSWNAIGENAFVLNDTNPCKYIHVTDVPAGQTNGKSAAPPLSVQITTTATTGNAGIWQYVQGLAAGSEQFEPGHTYEVSIWLKQTGSTGSATFSLGPVSHTFTGITSTWQQFTYTFAAPGALGSGQKIQLTYPAPGTMWVNQFRLWDTAHSPFTLDPRTVATFQTFNPGVIRIWSGFGNVSQNYSFWSLDSWLQDESASRADPGIGNIAYKESQQEKLPASLAMCSQFGANPWLICNMSWSEQEWSNFIDYLAAPAGVGYAVNRPPSHPGPYTADFSKIYLEFGNEEWGTQSTGVNNQYGQWAHYMFSQAIAGKSYYDPTKIKLILNNFTENPSFGNGAITYCPEAQSLDYFLYTGSSTTGDPGYQIDLLSIAGYKGDINLWTSNATASAAAGHPYEVTSYEGGNGSDNPNSSGNGDDSLAAAVGQLDVYLYAQQQGMTALSFFGYRLGSSLYTSHTKFAVGYIPHPIWEALSMRNQYCSGDIVSTDTNAAQLSTDGSNTPLVGVYAFHDTVANKADIVVISRDLNNSTPVTWHLPTASTGSMTVYMLTGDPRSNNDTTLVDPITTTTIASPGKSYTFTMPPGSIYLFQVPTAATWPAVGPVGLMGGSGSGYAQLSWIIIPTASSYKVYRGTSPTNIGTTAYASGITTNNYVDTGVTNGSTYYYRVTAVTASGETDASAIVGIPIVAIAPFLDINAGGAAISGTSWIADVDFSGNGFTQTVGSQTIPPTLINPAPTTVYQSLHANVSYAIPGMTPGIPYTVRIHGEEPYYTVANQRLADVAINGTTVETRLDWFSAAGGQNKGAARTYSFVMGPSGTLTVSLTKDPASIDHNMDLSGIEVTTGSVPLPITPSSITVTPGTNQATLNWAAVPQATSYTILYGTTSGTYTQAASGITTNSKTITGLTTGTTYYFVIAAVNAAGPSPLSPEVSSASTFIAINCGGPAIAGTNWVADEYGTGNYTQTVGTQIVPPNLVGAAPATVYTTVRSKPTYTIPGVTPGATYIVRLHGEEPYWNAAGKRVADVLINGTTVDSNLDWWAIAGGLNVAATRSYTIVQGSSTNLVIKLNQDSKGIDGNVEFSGVEVLKP